MSHQENNKMIVIIDYGMGNLGSILNMFKKIGVLATISSNEDDIYTARKIVLPGVGAFDNGMKSLRKRGLDVALQKRILGDGVPILGICLGMQLFTRRSEEGSEEGLGWIDAETIRFRMDKQQVKLKVPHMGWNTIEVVRTSPLFYKMQNEARFYFVHSYHVNCFCSSDELARTGYGYPFTSVIQYRNIYGTQFHPEKSHKYGLQLLKNFAERIQ